MRYFLTLLLLATSLVYADTVTWYVNGKNSLRPDGSLSEETVASFSQTSSSSKAGQITMGNCATFKLMDLPHIVITDITLTMHSNTASGAGALTLIHNGNIIASIADEPFSSDIWNGAYSSANVQLSVTLPSPQITLSKGDSIELSICASENSLYVYALTIKYREANIIPFMVNFYVGNEKVAVRKETQPNEGITLPSLPDTTLMPLFVGWTLSAIQNTDNLPPLWQPQQLFYPRGNISLYALFRNTPDTSVPWVQTTAFNSGDYLIASTYKHCLAIGGLNKQRKIDALQVPEWIWSEDSLRCLQLAEYPQEAVYHIDFLTDSTACIKNISSNEVIGFSSSSSSTLTHNTEPWNYIIYSDSQISFFHRYVNSIRYLWATEGESLIDADIISFAAQSYIYNGFSNILFNLSDEPQPLQIFYTSFPQPTELQNTSQKQIQIVGRNIHNPFCNHILIYSTSGILMFSTNAQIVSLPDFLHGVYILRCAGNTSKLFLN